MTEWDDKKVRKFEIIRLSWKIGNEQNKSQFFIHRNINNIERLCTHATNFKDQCCISGNNSRWSFILFNA